MHNLEQSSLTKGRVTAPSQIRGINYIQVLQNLGGAAEEGQERRAGTGFHTSSSHRISVFNVRSVQMKLWGKQGHHVRFISCNKYMDPVGNIRC